MPKTEDIDWNDILTMISQAYREKPDDFVVSIGHWFTPAPGIIGWAWGVPHPETFSAWLKLTVSDLKRYAEPCEWAESVRDAFWTEFDTTCGKTHAFDSHEENKFTFCPYCGRRLTTACTGLAGTNAAEGDQQEPANQ